MEHSSKMKWIVLLLIGVVFVSIWSALCYQKGAVYAELKTLHLIPSPESFTELYFKNPSSLSSTTAAGSPVSFAFIIHNEEGATTTYPYSVYFQNIGGEKIVLQNGQAILANQASATINISRPLPGASTGTIVADLTSLNQQIDFLVHPIH